MGLGPSSSCAFLQVEVSDGSETNGQCGGGGPRSGGGGSVSPVTPSGVAPALRGGEARAPGAGAPGRGGEASAAPEDSDSDTQPDPPFLLQEQWLTDVCGVPRRR